LHELRMNPVRLRFAPLGDADIGAGEIANAVGFHAN